MCHRRLFIVAVARGPRLLRKDLCVPVVPVNAGRKRVAGPGGNVFAPNTVESPWRLSPGHTPERCHTSEQGGLHKTRQLLQRGEANRASVKGAVCQLLQCGQANISFTVTSSCFDAAKMFQTGCRRAGRSWNAPRTPVWNISQVNRFTGYRSILELLTGREGKMSGVKIQLHIISI